MRKKHPMDRPKHPMEIKIHGMFPSRCPISRLKTPFRRSISPADPCRNFLEN